MLKAFPLLVVGVSLAMWGRSLTHDDRILLGVPKAGRLEARSTAGSFSLSASEALLQFGQKPAFETAFQKRQPGSAAHGGLNLRLARAMDWELRLPWWGLALISGFWLFVRARQRRGD